MLEQDCIHGDLSAYNILYWDGEITLIDFPQVVQPGAGEPGQNRSAFSIFERDVVRVCEYFSRQGVRADGKQLAAEMWKAHAHRITPLVDPQFLDPFDVQALESYQRSLRDE